ncbi:hypothetical protein HAX54_025527, partial [Datura stramonium]|nr:hypothetical protein [Datura stramonium]
MTLLITWLPPIHNFITGIIVKFNVWSFRYEERFAKHVDLWLHFATKAANLQELTLGLFPINEDQNYDCPRFAFKNGSFFRDLDLRHCQLNPRATVNWTSLISPKIGHTKLTDAAMKK